MIQRTIYFVAVRRGKRTRYFYGERLKDATEAAGLKLLKGGFVHAKFVRGREWFSEISPDGKMLASQPLTRRGRHVTKAQAA